MRKTPIEIRRAQSVSTLPTFAVLVLRQRARDRRLNVSAGDNGDPFADHSPCIANYGHASAKRSSVAARSSLWPRTPGITDNPRHAEPSSTGIHGAPRFDTIVTIMRAVDENVGWLLGERGFGLSSDERAKVQTAADILINRPRGDNERLTSMRSGGVAFRASNSPRDASCQPTPTKSRFSCL